MSTVLRWRKSRLSEQKKKKMLNTDAMFADDVVVDRDYGTVKAEDVEVDYADMDAHDPRWDIGDDEDS